MQMIPFRSSKIVRRVLRMAVLVAFSLGVVAVWALYISVRPPRISSDVTPKNFSVPYEDVSFTTRDGITLAGWFVPSAASSTKTIVALHGYPADKGDILPAVVFLQKTYNLFLFDFRYFGKSAGAYTTVGMRETEDLRAAIAFLKTRGITQVGVWGFSMGGAVALMASSQTSEIAAVAAESSYARLDLMASRLFRVPVLNRVLGSLVTWLGKALVRIDVTKVSPQAAAEKITIPVLLIHSQDDEVIPFSHAKLLQEALGHNTRAEFWFEENLAHGEFSAKYQPRIEEFFAKNL